MFVPNNAPSNNAKQRYDHLVWFIVGKPMSGKSSFANSFPNPLWINTDGNHFQFDTPHIYLDKVGVKVIDPSTQQEVLYHPWDYFKNTVTELISNPQQGGYQTIIVDLVEDLYEMCRDYTCKLHRKNHESEIGTFGQGYKLVADEFQGVLEQLASLKSHGYNILILSHEKIINERTVDEKVVETIYGSPLRGVVQNKIKGISHITGRTDKITIIEQSTKGPVEREEFILRVNENHSLASNRLFLPVDHFELSYNSWRGVVSQITNPSIEPDEVGQE